jgi:hypothetical protein
MVPRFHTDTARRWRAAGEVQGAARKLAKRAGKTCAIKASDIGEAYGMSRHAAKSRAR